MDNNITIQERQVISEVRYLPAVSIIMPFRPVVTKKSELEYRLKLIMKKIEQELVTHYPTEKAVPVIIRLKMLIRNLNFNTHTKSIAIFVSPVAEKVYYLEVEVEEQIICDESFELRDLILSKKNKTKYIVLTLSDEFSKTYIGNTSKFTLIKSNVVKPPVLTGSKSSVEILLNEFLHLMDQELSIIVNSYPLPVFVTGTKNVLKQFRNTTINEKNIVHFIERDNPDVEDGEMQIALMSYEFEWQKVKQKHVLNQVEKANCDNKLAIGIGEVWLKANQNKGSLLVLETTYKTPAGINWHDAYCKMEYPGANPFFIKDEVDEIIDLVLEGGGDVEYVEENMLNDYGHIALIGG